MRKTKLDYFFFGIHYLSTISFWILKIHHREQDFSKGPKFWENHNFITILGFFHNPLFAYITLNSFGWPRVVVDTQLAADMSMICKNNSNTGNNSSILYQYFTYRLIDIVIGNEYIHCIYYSGMFTCRNDWSRLFENMYSLDWKDKLDTCWRNSINFINMVCLHWRLL